MAAAAESLTSGSLFAWGCLGGFAAALLTMTLPWLYKVIEGTEKTPTVLVALFALCILAVQSFLGGVAALMVGQDVAHIGQAVALGLLWPTVFKSAGETLKEVLAKKEGD